MPANKLSRSTVTFDGRNAADKPFFDWTNEDKYNKFGPPEYTSGNIAHVRQNSDRIQINTSDIGELHIGLDALTTDNRDRIKTQQRQINKNTKRVANNTRRIARNEKRKAAPKRRTTTKRRAAPQKSQSFSEQNIDDLMRAT